MFTAPFLGREKSPFTFERPRSCPGRRSRGKASSPDTTSQRYVAKAASTQATHHLARIISAALGYQEVSDCIALQTVMVKREAGFLIESSECSHMY
mmetsp:Transcript_63800/g.149852  ORF Transcript_63800/g.149852 Transcript_63800/m.149852 type:complete len:96 (-) Transcript_63800:784-1071(-)